MSVGAKPGSAGSCIGGPRRACQGLTAPGGHREGSRRARGPAACTEHRGLGRGPGRDRLPSGAARRPLHCPLFPADDAVTSSTSESSALSKKRFTLQSFAALKGQKGKGARPRPAGGLLGGSRPWLCVIHPCRAHPCGRSREGHLPLAWVTRHASAAESLSFPGAGGSVIRAARALFSGPSLCRGGGELFWQRPACQELGLSFAFLVQLLPFPRALLRLPECEASASLWAFLVHRRVQNTRWRSLRACLDS